MVAGGEMVLCGGGGGGGGSRLVPGITSIDFSGGVVCAPSLLDRSSTGPDLGTSHATQNIFG